MTDEQPRSTRATILGWVGIVLQMVVGFPYLVSGLVVPVPYLFGVWLLWFLFTAAAVVLLRRRSLLVPLVPVAAVGTLLSVVALGGRFLDWTA